MVHEFLNSEGFLKMRVEETRRIEEGIEKLILKSGKIVGKDEISISNQVPTA
jgi:hypothetical protein